MPIKQQLLLGFCLFMLVSCDNRQTEPPNAHISTASSKPIKLNKLIKNFPLQSPSTTKRDSIFHHFVDSLAVTVKFIPCCDFDRADTYLYFDSSELLIARSVQYITSSQALHPSDNFSRFIHNQENLSPSLFFTEADGIHYHYDSSKQKLTILPYDKLQLPNNDEKFIQIGLGLNPNIKYAFLNVKTLEPICDFIYEQTEPFSHGLAIVTKNAQMGLINTEGEEVIACLYDNIYPHFDNELVVVEIADQYGLVNIKGEKIISCAYDRIAYFKDGLALVEKEDKYGVINTKKQQSISCNYESGNFRDRFLALFSNGSFYDRFQVVAKDIFFEEGVAIVLKDNKYGLLDSKGKEIAPCIYEDMDDFLEIGLVLVEKKAKYGLINTKGKKIAPCQYDYIDVYLENKFLILEKDDASIEAVMIDTKGKKISQKYAHIASFENGFSIAEKKGKQVMLNTKGKEISNYYEDIGYFRNGFAIIKRKGLHGLISKKGEEFIPCKYKNIYLELHPEKLDSVYRVRVSQNGGKNVTTYDLPQY